MHSSRLSPCCQSDRVQGPPSSPCQIPGQSGQHGPAVQPPVLKEVPSRWPGVCSGWGTVLGSRPVTRTAARLQGQSWARPDAIGSSCLLQHLPVPTEPTSQVQTRESDCFLNPRMRAWKEGCGVKRTGTASVCLWTPSMRQAKMVSSLRFLVRMVPGLCWASGWFASSGGQDDTGLSRIACFSS